MKKKRNWKLIGIISASVIFGIGLGMFITSTSVTCVCQLPLELFSR